MNDGIHGGLYLVGVPMNGTLGFVLSHPFARKRRKDGARWMVHDQANTVNRGMVSGRCALQ